MKTLGDLSSSISCFMRCNGLIMTKSDISSSRTSLVSCLHRRYFMNFDLSDGCSKNTVPFAIDMRHRDKNIREYSSLTSRDMVVLTLRHNECGGIISFSSTGPQAIISKQNIAGKMLNTTVKSRNRNTLIWDFLMLLLAEIGRCQKYIILVILISKVSNIAAAQIAPMMKIAEITLGKISRTSGLGPFLLTMVIKYMRSGMTKQQIQIAPTNSFVFLRENSLRNPCPWSIL